jgi:Arc/MetJ-type ribon-helix-helix transcriptional regulator
MATSTGQSLRVTLSEKSVDLLEQLTEKGIYGKSKSEVAGRFIDSALQRELEKPHLKLELDRKKKKR